MRKGEREKKKIERAVANSRREGKEERDKGGKKENKERDVANTKREGKEGETKGENVKLRGL